MHISPPQAGWTVAGIVTLAAYAALLWLVWKRHRIPQTANVALVGALKSSATNQRDAGPDRYMTAYEVIHYIADDSKWVETLGRFPLPIEVISFGLGATRRQIEKAFADCGVSGQLVIRNGRDGHVFVTDSGHWIVDAHLGRIPDAPRLAQSLGSIPGVVEHGLFIGLASIAMLAGASGIRVVERR